MSIQPNEPRFHNPEAENRCTECGYVGPAAIAKSGDGAFGVCPKCKSPF